MTTETTEWIDRVLHLTHPINGRMQIKPIREIRGDGMGNYVVFIAPHRKLVIPRERIVAFEQAPLLRKQLTRSHWTWLAATVGGVVTFWLAIAVLIKRAFA